MKKIVLAFSTVAFLLIRSEIASASIETLLSSKHRPSIEEVKNEVKNHPDEVRQWMQPYSEPKRIKVFREKFEEVVKAAVLFEAYYPGATLAFLGRDSAFLEDVFELIFEVSGRDNKVVRLDASGTSISLNQKKLLFDFLVSNGMPSDELENQRPFVVVDSTTYTKTSSRVSQSRVLMEAAYGALSSKGYSPAEIANKISFVNIHPLKRSFDVGETLKPSVFLSASQKLVNEDGPMSILSILIDAELTYGPEWHEAFGSIAKDSTTGRLRGRPGELGSTKDRSILLYEQLWLVKFFEDQNRISLVKSNLAPDINLTSNYMPTDREIAEQVKNTVASIKEESASIKLSIDAMRAGGKTMRTAGDFIKIMSPGVKSPTEEYINEISNLWEEQSDFFVSLNPTFDELNVVKKQTQRISSSILLMKKMILKTKNIYEVERILEPGVGNPVDAYISQIRSLWDNLGEHLATFSWDHDSIIKFKKMIGFNYLLEIKLLKAIIPKLNSAQLMIEFLNPRVSSPRKEYLDDLDSVLFKYADHFAALHPTMDELAELKNSHSRTNGLIKAMLECARVAKTSREILDILDPKVSSPSDYYLGEIDKTWKSVAAQFASTHPSLEEWKEFKLRQRSVEQIIAVADEGLDQARSVEEFFGILEPVFENPTDAYLSNLNNLFRQHWEKIELIADGRVHIWRLLFNSHLSSKVQVDFVRFILGRLTELSVFEQTLTQLFESIEGQRNSELKKQIAIILTPKETEMKFSDAKSFVGALSLNPKLILVMADRFSLSSKIKIVESGITSNFEGREEFHKYVNLVIEELVDSEDWVFWKNLSPKLQKTILGSSSIRKLSFDQLKQRIKTISPDEQMQFKKVLKSMVKTSEERDAFRELMPTTWNRVSQTIGGWFKKSNYQPQGCIEALANDSF